MTLELKQKPARNKRHMTREEGKEMVDALTAEREEADADALADLAARGRAGLMSVADNPVFPEGWGEVNGFTRTEECPACQQEVSVLADGNLMGHAWIDDPSLACGGPDIGRLPRTVDVTAYGPDGESIVVTQAIKYHEVRDGEVVDPPRAAGDWSASTPVIKITLPGFEAPIDVDIVKLNFTGNIELDIVGEEHRAIWNALRWKGMTTLIVQAKVRDLALQERTGDRAQATLKILSVTRYTPPADAHSPFQEGESSEEEVICDRCGEDLAIDGLYCGACIAAMDAEDAEEPAAEADTPSVASALDEAIGTALAAETDEE